MIETKEVLEILTKELEIKITKKGKNVFFICPFHNDKNPSLSFEINDKFFKCFSCEFKAKNIIVFWSKLKKISIEEAEEKLANLGYIELKKKRKIEEENEETKLLKIFKIVKMIYQNNLFSKKGKKQLDYLIKKRSLKLETIENFEIGSTIENNQISTLLYLENDKYSISEIYKSGLFSIKNEKKLSDFFWEEEIIFPIKNQKGEVISFAARSTEERSENKYLFLPNNYFANKSSNIYNYHIVKQNISNECYLVEGFFDVISMSQSGIKNCISLLGTSISKEQVKMLKALEKKVLIFLDSDEPGIEATINICLTLSLNEIECEVIDNQTKMDPDEICRLEDKSILEIIKKRRIPFFFVILHYYKKMKVEENPQRARRFILIIATVFKHFKNNIHKFVIKKLSLLIGIEPLEIEKIYFSCIYKKKENEFLIYENEYKNLEEALIYYSCRSRSTWDLIKEKKYNFLCDEYKFLFEKINYFYENNLSKEKFDKFEKEKIFENIRIFDENEYQKKQLLSKVLF